MPDWDPGAEVKEEKLEKGAGDGEDAGACPFAVLPCVTDESNAGPGISEEAVSRHGANVM